MSCEKTWRTSPFSLGSESPTSAASISKTLTDKLGSDKNTNFLSEPKVSNPISV